MREKFIQCITKNKGRESHSKSKGPNKTFESKTRMKYQAHYDAEVYPKISALVKLAQNLDTYNERK